MRALAEQPPTAQTPELDRELRIKTDTATWLAETLHGSMQTTFEFNFDGQELKGEDGGSLNEVFDDAIEEARAMVEWNPSLLFELRRRLIERDELDDMYQMVEGSLPNTMVVISDFPPELMDASEDVGGYNTSRRQTMMRIIALGGDGVLRVTSQSLDGSDREALEAVYAALGEPVQEGEMLSQRIHRDMSANQQADLTERLTRAYDSSLAEQHGSEWHAGIKQEPMRNILNTYDFVMNQQDLLEWFTEQKMADPAGAERHRYKIAATAKARHERYLRGQDTVEASASGTGLIPGTVSRSSMVKVRSIVAAKTRVLENELVREERRAAERGDVFSGCGATVDAGGLTGSSLATLGYGNKAGNSSGSSFSEDCEFMSEECPECHEKKVWTKVTKTHISGSCGCSKMR